MFIAEELDRYFYWQEERESIRKKKENDLQPPWTNDPILQEFKFCQVYREEDRTTRWLRKHIREPLRDDPRVFMAVMIYCLIGIERKLLNLLDNNLNGLLVLILLKLLIVWIKLQG